MLRYDYDIANVNYTGKVKTVRSAQRYFPNAGMFPRFSSQISRIFMWQQFFTINISKKK